MCKKCHQCFITLETLTNSASISLPDSARIRNGRITSIMVRRSGSATLKTAKGTTLATDAVLGTAHLSIKNVNGDELTSPIPVSAIQRDYTNPEPFCVDWTNVDLTQSTIVLDFGAATATHALEVVFGLDCKNC